MTEILIVYGTRHGHTAHIAERVASGLRSEGNEVEVRNARGRPSLESHHQAIIVGASVHADAYEHEIREWVQAHLDGLGGRPSAFFSVSLASATHDDAHDAEAQEVTRHFFQQVGWHPIHVGKFGGALEYSKYNPLIRLVMTWIVRKKEHGRYLDTSRDYDLTDYAEVDAFARAFAQHLRRHELDEADRTGTVQAHTSGPVSEAQP